jgi:hypothetical protein
MVQIMLVHQIFSRIVKNHSSKVLVVIIYGFIEHLGVHFLTGIARSGLEPGTSVSETR